MSLRLIPAGSTITRTYYAVPAHYGIGEEFEDFLSAARHALLARDALKERLREGYPKNWSEEFFAATAKATCVVDLRWVIKTPTGSTDTVIERTNVDHLTLEHCDKYSKVSHG
jgi:hypothetical protein